MSTLNFEGNVEIDETGEKIRTAACCCGESYLKMRGEPERVIICHCIYCQRKTGSVANNSSWWIKDQIVEKKIDNMTILNDTPGNIGIDYHFCKRCGTTLFWTVDAEIGDHDSEHGDGKGGTVVESSQPGHLAISVGCFGDPNFPAPTDEWLYENKHHWVPMTVETEGFSFEGFPTPERVAFDPEWLEKYWTSNPAKK